MTTGTASGFDRLIVNAERGQWAVAEAIDWNLPLRPPRWLPRRIYGSAVSQLYHGEAAAARVCERLLGIVDERKAHRFLAIQLADELRHVEVYDRYLRRLGEIAPLDEPLARVFDCAATETSSVTETVLAYHVVVESEGLLLQQAFLRWITCPLLSQVNLRTSRDEARHVAFGRLFLRRMAATLQEEERAAAAATVERQWRRCAEALVARYGGHLGRRLGRDWLDRRWALHQRTFREIGFLD
jgi:hypothetical protein